MNKIYNYINGKFLSPLEGKWLNNYNPSLGSIYGHIPDSSSKDVALAEQAASKAFLLGLTLQYKNGVIFYRK